MTAQPTVLPNNRRKVPARGRSQVESQLRTPRRSLAGALGSLAFMRTVIFFLIALTVQRSYAGDYAWWLTETYVPVGHVIESIPIAEIDSSWAEAMVLSKEKLSLEGQEYLSHVGDEFSFSKIGDFNGDGRQDKALVGAYKDREDHTGLFILILSSDKKEQWVKSYLELFPGPPGFSIFYGSDVVCLLDCFECDSASYLHWNGKAYEWIEPEFEY